MLHRVVSVLLFSALLQLVTAIYKVPHAHRAILGHERKLFVNRLRDPQLAVPYHSGKDEHGEVLQKPKWNTSHVPPIEVEAYLLKKQRLHLARRAIEFALLRKEPFHVQMADAVKAMARALSNPRNAPTVRRLTEHFQKTGRRLAAFVDPYGKKEVPQDLSIETHIEYRISRSRLRRLSGGKPRALNQVCNAHVGGQTWMKELCVDRNQPEGQEVNGIQVGNQNLCEVCSGPGQLCENEASCNDKMLKCTQLNEMEKEQLEAEFKQTKAKNPKLTIDTHPCLLPYCPALRNEIARNSKCGEAVFEYCCDPAMDDCPLDEKTSCTAVGCSTILDDNFDMHWLIEEVMKAEGIQFINEEEKWDYFEKQYEKRFQCPFSDKKICDDFSTSYCAKTEQRGGMDREPWESHPHWRDLGEVSRLPTSLNQPCWHGYCFNQAVLDFCAFDDAAEGRPPFKPSDGAPTAGQVFEMMFSGQTPMDKVSVANMVDDAPGCKIGCRPLLEFISAKAQESASGQPSKDISPFDIEFPDPMNNTVTVCESTFRQMIAADEGMPGGESRNLDEDGDSGENMDAGENTDGAENMDSDGGEQMVQDTSHEFRQCLFGQCAGCFPMGEDGNSLTTGMKTNDIEYILFTGTGVDAEREQCAYDVAMYCKSAEGKEDPTCLGETCEKRMKADPSLCNTVPNLKTYFSLPLCQKASCIKYQNDLVTLYGKRGYFQPGDPWQEGFLRFQNALLYPKNQKPTLDWTLSDADNAVLAESKAGCQDTKAVDAYVQTIVPYCNAPGRGHADICRGFSKCGDGVVTWGESCDPGPGSDPTFDGCQRCEHLKEGFACAQPGLPCGRCDLDTRILQQSTGKDEACPFCLNNKLKGKGRDMGSSPCDCAECKEITSKEGARKCDDFVFEYCHHLLALGMSDPGCVNYINQTLKYAVPRVSSNCTYKFHDIDLSSEYVESNDEKERGGGLITERIAIIDCEFVDETGKNKDNTPLFQHISLLKPPIKDLFTPPTDANVVPLLDELENTFGEGGMVELTELKLEHFYEYQSAALHKDGRPLDPFVQSKIPWFGMLAIEDAASNWNLPFRDPKNQNWNNNDRFQKSCRASATDVWNTWAPTLDHQKEGLHVVPLPPCEDATMWAVKAKALEYKFRGTHYDGWTDESRTYGVRDRDEKGLDQRQTYRPLASLKPDKFKPTCIPRKNHFVAMVSVSRTIDSRNCWGSDCPPRGQGDNPVAQLVKYDSFIPRTLSTGNHCDDYCCRKCYDSNGNDANMCAVSNQHCMTSDQRNLLEGPDGCCKELASKPPVKVEDAIKSGAAKFVFGNRLFQKGCVDHDCEFRVEHCNTVDMSPAILAPNATALEEAANAVVYHVNRMDDGVSSWGELTQANFEVSAAAMAQGFSDSLSLFEKMVTMTKVSETIEGIDGYCPHEYWNHTGQSVSALWKNDPCCNWELRRSQCCLPQTVAGAEVDVIGHINSDAIVSSCRTPKKVEALLADVGQSIQAAGKCASDLDNEVGVNALNSLWEFREACEKKIGYQGTEQMDGKGVCTTNADCFCTYSTCGADGKCIPAANKFGECFSQCFESEAPSKLVRFLKLEWNISASDSTGKFEKMFVEKMTEPTCVGEESWHQDIGQNRLEWRCNSTCQKTNLCHSHDILQAFESECSNACWESGGHNCWQSCSPWNSKAICESSALRNFIPNLNTTWVVIGTDSNGNEYGHCNPAGVNTPCGCEQCRRPCEDKTACEDPSNGGTYFSDGGGGSWGQCCPAGNFIHVETTKDQQNNDVEYKSCRPMKQGTPSGHSVRNENCCRSAGGTWNGAQSSCCFGNLKVECDWRGECITHCEEWTDTWKPCRECEEKQCGGGQCKACDNRRSGCCGETLVTANKTACLSYARCNDRDLHWRLQEDQTNAYHAKTKLKQLRQSAACGAFTAPAGVTGQKTIVYDDQGVCMECWGSHCRPRSEPAECLIEEIFGQRVTQSMCETANRTWLVYDHCRTGQCTSQWDGRCLDLHADVVDGTTCFRRNSRLGAQDAATVTSIQADLVSHNTTMIPEWRKNEIKQRTKDGTFHQPLVYFGEGSADAGVGYIAPSSPNNCASGYYYDNEREVCRRWVGFTSLATDGTGTSDAGGSAGNTHLKTGGAFGYMHRTISNGDTISVSAISSGSCSIEPKLLQAAGALIGGKIQLNTPVTSQASNGDTCQFTFTEAGEFGVTARVFYRQGRYLTKEECDAGTCVGSLRETQHFALWSAQQCSTLSKPYCDRSCPKCTSTGRYNGAESGQAGNMKYSQTYKLTASGATQDANTLKFDSLPVDIPANTQLLISAYDGGSCAIAPTIVTTGSSVTSSTTNAGTIAVTPSLTTQAAVSNKCQVTFVTTAYPEQQNTGLTHRDKYAMFEWSNHGGCFDTLNGLVTEEKYTRNALDCTADNAAGGKDYTWYSCTEQPWNASCTTSLPAAVQGILQCRSGGANGHHWDTCPTEELCAAVGDCHGDGAWDYGSARGCDDSGWTFGASHWGRGTESVSTTIGEGNTAETVQVTREKWFSCSNSRWSQAGVCVDTVSPMENCPHWLTHPKGCRVDVPWINVNGQQQQNQTACTTASDGSSTGHVFLTRLDTKPKCEAIQGCKEPFQWGYTPKSQSKCTTCGGQWEPQFYWKGGNWKGGKTEPLTWDAQGIRIASANLWTSSFSERKMRAELQIPLMRMFAETKKSQALIRFNSYMKTLSAVACDCGIEDFGSACWDSSNNSALVAVGTSFCGNEANVMQGGCSKVQVNQACAGSSRRRRLQAAGDTSDALALSFGHVSVGLYSQPICTETGAGNTCTCTSSVVGSKIETFGGGIKNANGVTIGQLVGDGAEFIAPNGFPSSIEKCLPFRIDVNARRALFNTTDVARLDASGAFVTMGFGDFGDCSGACVSIKQQKICFKATAAGTYFPILRRHQELSTDTQTCSIPGFKDNHGICLSGTNEKYCFCGYYGQACDKGCPNACSQSTAVNSWCDANTNICTCPSTHKGTDCALLNCPTDANGNMCYNHGTCKLKNGAAQCECASQYSGNDCSKTVIVARESDNGYPKGVGLTGVAGMAFQFGWQFPGLLVAILLWILILTPCCWVACCFYCPCCCRKKNTCCWAEKGLCACKCCHTHCEHHAVRLGKHAELMKHKYFAKFDADHDGLMDPGELVVMCKQRFGAVVTTGQMDHLIKQFDLTGKGKLTEAEYQAMLTSLENQDSDHTKKGLRDILESLPDGGNIKGSQVVPINTREPVMI
jgi:hypothetical protein